MQPEDLNGRSRLVGGELVQMQRRFWHLITAPEGVAAALPLLAEGDPACRPLHAWIHADSEPRAIERLDVYANMYFYRLLDILRGDYAKVAALVGESTFHNLITDYLLAHPSTQPSVRHIGRHLPHFLGTHRLASEMPYLEDLARLEWARLAVFDAPHAIPLTAEALKKLAPEAWAELLLGFVPAAQLLRLPYPVHRLWLALHGGEPAPALAAEPSALLVWRKGVVVFHRPVPAGEAEALALLASPLRFADLCERMAGSAPDAEAAARSVLALLGRWVEDEIIATPEAAGE